MALTGCSDPGTMVSGPVETETEALTIARRYVEALPPSGPAANHDDVGRILNHTEDGPAPPGSWLVAFDLENTEGTAYPDLHFVIEVDRATGEAKYQGM